MGAGAGAGLGATLKVVSPDELADVIKSMPPDQVDRIKAVMQRAEQETKKPAGPPPMQKLELPFGPLSDSIVVDIKDDPTHKMRFEDDEGCVRIYEPLFDKPGQVSKVHFHDAFTAYLFLGNPDEAQTESAMEMCQVTDGGLQIKMAFKMPGFPCGMCSCVFFPHPQFGTKIVHRVGIPANFEAKGRPFNQLGCEVKAWPKAATLETLPPQSEGGATLPPPYAIPPMAPETTKFRLWRLELRPGDDLPAHGFSFPAVVLCGCGGGDALKASTDGPSDSPLLGLAMGDYRWLPTGCAKVGPLHLPKDASEPYVVAVVELIKEGLC